MRLKPFAIAIFEEERRQTARGGQVELKLSVRPLKRPKVVVVGRTLHGKAFH